MDWTPGGMSDDVEDRRGDEGGGGGGFGFGGGGLGIVGVLFLLVISLITGRNFIGAYLMGGGGARPVQQQQQRQSSGPIQESTSEHRSAQLISFTLDDVQRFWTAQLPEQTQHNYRHAHLVLYRDETNSGCGGAQSATGPFYCPQDEKVYLDLGFWSELKRMGGDAGDFAQSYVLAHELGHHVQKILGTSDAVTRAMRANPSQRNALSVRLELQADCYAGVWGHSASERGIIHESDVDDALKAAAAVGDDHLQKMSGRAISPDSFTHGSSAQRIAWFRRGLSTGRVDACNTFSNAATPQ